MNLAFVGILLLSLLLLACSLIGGGGMSDSERLREIGVRLGGTWPIEPECPTLYIRFDPTSGLVDNPPGSTDAVYSYNAHEELEANFARAGGWPTELGERELVRDSVTKWRKGYADWLANTETAVAGCTDVMRMQRMAADQTEKCQHQANTLVFRYRLVLGHVDALLD